MRTLDKFKANYAPYADRPGTYVLLWFNHDLITLLPKPDASFEDEGINLLEQLSELSTFMPYPEDLDWLADEKCIKFKKQ